jgi:hypothetical protein
MTDAYTLALRIVEDNTRVIEGNYAELQEAWGMISQWRMSEECKERNVDHAYVRKLNDAEWAIKTRIENVKKV